MKNTKRIMAVLMAAVFVVSLSACEISREGREEPSTNDRTYEYVNDADLEGDDISDMIYGEGSDYQLWYADNGDIYAFNSAKQFYLKSGDSLYYGTYKFTTSSSTIYYGLLSLASDNDSSIDETFNVNMEEGDFILTRASNPDDIIRISKSEAGVSEQGSADEPVSEGMDVSGSGPAETNAGESEGTGNSSGNIYEVMGLNIYYLTMAELIDGETSVLKVNAYPAWSVKAEDGTVKYEYDSENSVQFTISEDANIYMPDISAPSNETYGCDIYQMKECLESFGGFYATVIGEGDNVEAVQYCHVAG